jgi:uncharacterized protein YutE (UPF0331/DUF86 family)
MYQCFDGSIKHFDVDEHALHAHKRTKVLKEIEEYVPVIVGEWSLGLSPNEHINDKNEKEVLKKYAQAQIEAMRECTGHTFWSYKVENKYSGWNFRDLVQRGIINMEEFLK